MEVSHKLYALSDYPQVKLPHNLLNGKLDGLYRPLGKEKNLSPLLLGFESWPCNCNQSLY